MEGWLPIFIHPVDEPVRGKASKVVRALKGGSVREKAVIDPIGVLRQLKPTDSCPCWKWQILSLF